MYNLLAENISVYVTVAAILIVFGLLIFAFFLAKKRKEPKYTAKDALLTPTEIKYYDLISEMIGNRYLFFPQINLAVGSDKVLQARQQLTERLLLLGLHQ